jgi:putative oxidoreductase
MSATTRKSKVGLWIAQGVLAALFIFGGGYKLVAPAAQLAAIIPLPPLFIKFIGLCEFTGGLGLVLPGIFRIRTDLTPLAATGLTIIMVGAVITTVLTVGTAPAIFPFVVGVLTTTVACGRRQRAPHTAASFATPLQTAGGI